MCIEYHEMNKNVTSSVTHLGLSPCRGLEMSGGYTKSLRPDVVESIWCEATAPCWQSQSPHQQSQSKTWTFSHGQGSGSIYMVVDWLLLALHHEEVIFGDSLTVGVLMSCTFSSSRAFYLTFRLTSTQLCNFNPLFLHWHLPTTHLVHPQRIRLLEIQIQKRGVISKMHSLTEISFRNIYKKNNNNNNFSPKITLKTALYFTCLIPFVDRNFPSPIGMRFCETDHILVSKFYSKLKINHFDFVDYNKKHNNNIKKITHKIYHCYKYNSLLQVRLLNETIFFKAHTEFSLSVKMSKNKEDEELTPYIGRFGRWHLYIYVVVALMDVPGSMMIFVMTFYTPNMDFWCARPDHLNRSAISVKTWRNFSSPPAAYPPTESDGQCIRYDVDYHKLTELRVFDIAINKTTQCKHWEYDLGIYERTMIEESQSIPDLQPPTTDPVHPESSLAQKRSLFGEFDLVCSRNILISTSNSIYMAGFMVGVIASGHMADMFVFQLFFYSYQLYNFEMFECGYVSISPCAVD
ncbi:hypothetical protein GQR58_011363 [Nymphon striatum]|nr:hypothetical protein GQR58_011363 [Nymphon striatum]